VPADDFLRFSADDPRFASPTYDDDRKWWAENDRASEELQKELAREKEEVEQRENRLAALAERQEQREARRERRERLMFWIAVFGLMFSIIAAVTGTIAIT